MRSKVSASTQVASQAEVERAIDARAAMAAIGNLNDYVKYQLAQGMAQGAGGPAAAGSELAVGLAVAQELLRQQRDTGNGGKA